MELINISSWADSVQAASLVISFILTGIFYKRYNRLEKQLKNEELLDQLLK